MVSLEFREGRTISMRGLDISFAVDIVCEIIAV